MEIAKISVTENRVEVLSKKPITAGMVGATVAFVFDENWYGLQRTFVWKAGNVTVDDANASGNVPHELLKEGTPLAVGVYGVSKSKTIPTLWAELGTVMPSADPSMDESTDPSLPVWAQLQSNIGDKKNLETENKDNLVVAINEVNTANEDLQNKSENAAEAIGTLTQDVEDLKTHAENVDKTIGEAEEKIEALEADAKATGERIAAVEGKVADNTAEIDGFFIKSSNLYKGDYVPGRLDEKGAVVDNEDLITIDYVKIDGHEGKYILPYVNGTLGCNGYAFYDSNKTFLSGVATTSFNAIVIPEGACYFRMSQGRDMIYFVGINSDGSEMAYEEYYAYLASKCLRLTDHDIMGLRISALLNDCGYIDRAMFEETFKHRVSKNLLNPDTEITGRITAAGELDETLTDFTTSDYINVDGYAGSYIVPMWFKSDYASGSIVCNSHAFYDAAKTIISVQYGTHNTAILIPEGAVYVRLSIQTLSTYPVKFIGINSDGSAMEYEEYYDRYVLAADSLDYETVKDEVLPTNWYKGKKASALGDSITNNGNTYYTEDNRSGSAWREFVAQELELSDTIYNCGIGGTKVSGANANAMWQDARIASIPEDSDIVFFNGGMNDWIANAPLGDPASTDTSTFYGALNVIAQKLTERFPNAVIFWMTTTFGSMNDSVLNSNNLSCYDYGRCVKEVAERHGFPVIDLHALCGWNQYNCTSYVNVENEGADIIHPNREGGKKMAAAICSVVKNYQLNL